MFECTCTPRVIEENCLVVDGWSPMSSYVHLWLYDPIKFYDSEKTKKKKINKKKKKKEKE